MRIDTLRRKQLGDGDRGAAGPDLGFLILSDVDGAGLEARNAFSNLDLHAEAALSTVIPEDHGVGFMSAFAEELKVDLPPEPGHALVKGFRGSSCIGYGQAYRQVADDLDCIDFKPMGGGPWPLPSSFGGFSGAGLWPTGKAGG